MNTLKEDQEHLVIEKGKGGLQFVKRKRKAIIKSPLHNFEQIEQIIEYRKDPLTNHWSRVNALRAERVKQAAAPGSGYETFLSEIVTNSGNRCFFCPESILQSTPQFPAKLGIGDRIIIDDFTLVPNLFAFAEFHAVGILGKKHFTNLDSFNKKTWENAIEGTVKYFSAVNKYQPEACYPSINFNFLPPSASSIIHPHIQVVQDIAPTKLTAQLIQASEKYHLNQKDNSDSNGNYWLDLIASEKELKKRFIYDNGILTWLATFSPLGKNELTGIIKKPITDITKLTKEDIAKVAEGITKALKALYLGRGARSVNMAMFLGPIDQDISEYYRISMKLVSRPIPSANYTGDIGFMELLHNETIAEASPEMITQSVKNHF